MADLRSKMIEQLTCPICQELFTTPKLLDCLHRFCEDCLHNYFMSRKVNHIDQVPCPKCRQTNTVDRDITALRKHQWAKCYPTDFETETLCEILREDTESCSTHEGEQVLGYCQLCRSCICGECDHQCDGFVSLKTEVSRRKRLLQTQQGPLKKKTMILRKQIKATRTEREELERNYDSTLAKIQEEFNSVRQVLDEEEQAVCGYLQGVRNEGKNKLFEIENKKKERLRKIAITEKKLSNAISTKSSARFIEKTQNAFERFDDCDVDRAINPDSYAQKTNIRVRKAKKDEIREQIMHIVPGYMASRNLGTGGGQPSSTSQPSGMESDSDHGDLVMSPPLTPYFSSSMSSHFSQASSSSDPMTP